MSVGTHEGLPKRVNAGLFSVVDQSATKRENPEPPAVAGGNTTPERSENHRTHSNNAIRHSISG